MKRLQIINLYDAALSILRVLKAELDSREDGYDNIKQAIELLNGLADWYGEMEDW